MSSLPTSEAGVAIQWISIPSDHVDKLASTPDRHGALRQRDDNGVCMPLKSRFFRSPV